MEYKLLKAHYDITFIPQCKHIWERVKYIHLEGDNYELVECEMWHDNVRYIPCIYHKVRTTIKNTT